MRAEDIRVGNYVDYECTTHCIVDINSIGCGSYWLNGNNPEDYYTHLYRDIKGIPITDDWLIRFGFKLNECDNYELAYLFEINSTFTIINEDRGYFYIDARNNELEYVHQLQNLYFALVGKELVLN